MNCNTSDMRKEGNKPHKQIPKNMIKSLKQESNLRKMKDIGFKSVSPLPPENL